MDINSKEFKKQNKNLFDKGFCASCIAKLTGTYTLTYKNDLCKNCQKIFEKLGE